MESTQAKAVAEEPLPLRLEPVTGPPLDPILLDEQDVVAVNRLGNGGRALPHESVSKSHAEFRRGPAGWAVVDVGSRHGTFLNEVRLRPDQPVPMRPGDVVRIRPWALLVCRADDASTVRLDAAETAASQSGLRELGPVGLMVGDRVLRGLVQAASSLAAADSEEILAEDLVREATRLTGFTRATLLRPAGESVTVLASQDDGLSDAGQPTFSRSLVRLAARGRGAVLGQVDLSSAASVDALGIVSAVCVPIVVAGVPAMALYLDSRKGEARAVGGAELIASALAEIVGPSFARLRARVVESQLARVEDEVRLAWDIQQEMMPRSPGSAGPLRFAMCSLPGRGMSGDLFDVFEAPDGRAVVWLGDVAGKGPAAAMLMARVQAGLRTAIDCGVPIPQALSRIAADVARLTNGLRFVTLLLLEIAADGRSVRAFDAGHGYGAILSASGSRPFGGAAGDSGSPPLGTVDDDVYAPIELHLDPGDRLLLMSDGVVEQPDPEHNEFGLERAIAAARSTDPSVAVSEVRAAVEGHRRTREQFDDVTIAVIA